jgi:hypothetical protein
MIVNTRLTLPHPWTTLRPLTPKKTARSRPPLTMPACTSDRYSHLLRLRPPAAPARVETTIAQSTTPKSTKLAEQIIEAGKRSRTATGVGVALPTSTSLAGQIIAAGKKRRGLEFA